MAEMRAGITAGFNFGHPGFCSASSAFLPTKWKFNLVGTFAQQGFGMKPLGPSQKPTGFYNQTPRDKGFHDPLVRFSGRAGKFI